mmetsp:Transcript_23164/g.46992  ORF Transcript_23164/g.46992 Transcript_23164/m.46992 type:complete len:107 (+) Transcript_23164:748-1068(+)
MGNGGVKGWRIGEVPESVYQRAILGVWERLDNNNKQDLTADERECHMLTWSWVQASDQKGPMIGSLLEIENESLNTNALVKLGKGKIYTVLGKIAATFLWAQKSYV